MPLAIAALSLAWRGAAVAAQDRAGACRPGGALPAAAASPPRARPEGAGTTDPAAPEDVPEADWTDPDSAKTDPVVAAVPDITQPGTPPDARQGAIPVEMVHASGSDARRAHHSGAVDFRMDPSRSGRVDISLSRSGSVSFPGERRGGTAKRASTPMLGNENDPRNEEYKALFTEFMRLRRTTGEAVENLDAVDFVEALQDKRAQLIRELGVKDVRFRLAFDNGKAAIRYMTDRGREGPVTRHGYVVK